MLAGSASIGGDDASHVATSRWRLRGRGALECAGHGDGSGGLPQGQQARSQDRPVQVGGLQVATGNATLPWPPIMMLRDMCDALSEELLTLRGRSDGSARVRPSIHPARDARTPCRAGRTG